jgi:LmbE family N-acetylglucosaminyl deacetylase
MLVVVAHPDDETFGTGSVIAHAAAHGVAVTVCCATHGEAGEDASGTTGSRDELATVRAGELREAAAVLGAHEVVLLDFGDSDMQGAMPAHALCAVPVEVVAEAVADVVRRVQPDVVVAFDPESVADHRDHQRIGEATVLAFAAAAPEGARLYAWTLLRSAMVGWAKQMVALGRLEKYHDMELGRPDDEITTVVDVADVLDARRAAIAAHRTQASPLAGLSPDLERVFLTRDHFVRLVPPWAGGPQETSLFDPIRPSG